MWKCCGTCELVSIMRLRGRGDGPCGGGGDEWLLALLGLGAGERTLVGLVLLGESFPPRGGGGPRGGGAAGATE